MSAKLPSDSSDYSDWLTDALSAGESGIDVVLDNHRLKGFAIRFNREIDATVREHGNEQVATAIWYIYGCVSGYMQDVLDPSLGRLRFEFMASVKTLYADGFNRHCVPRFDDDEIGGLNTACYMLWDMDSIEYAAARDADAEMLRASLDILTFALSLDNPACHKSALHGLGHLVAGHESEVQPIIQAYLRAKPPKAQRSYAKAALTGCIQ